MSEKKYERGRKRETERGAVRTGIMRERERSEKSERLVERAKRKLRERVRTEKLRERDINIVRSE